MKLKKKLSTIFEYDANDIIIDDPMNDIFTFYGDKRNNIHLLLYFNVCDDKYDILPAELPVVYEAKFHKIPIIFLVNKCPKRTFKPKKLEKLIKEVKEYREETDFKDNKTFCINCITKNGFNYFLEGLYKEYEKNIIEEKNLQKIKDGSLTKEEFIEIYKDSSFFADIKPEDVFLNESLLKSVKDIKSLVVQLAAYYSNELGFWKSMGFYLFNNCYNNMKIDSETNFFPLLTNLIKKIYENFGINNKTEKDCNNFIKIKISEYFNINIELEKQKLKEEKDKKGKDKKMDKKGIDKENDKKQNGKKDKEEDKKENENGKKAKEKENKEDEEGGVTPPLIMHTNTGTNTGDEIYPVFSLEDMVEEDEIDDFVFEDAPVRQNKFTIEQFEKDFKNLGRLYWNSEKNFQISEKIENKYIKDIDKLEKDLFEDKENIIEPERLFQLVKKDFNLDNSKIKSTKQEKLILKLFYIFYCCHELISELCGKYNQSGFKYKSICSFYYTVSNAYNEAIKGFLKIKETIENEKKNAKIYESYISAAPV